MISGTAPDLVAAPTARDAPGPSCEPAGPGRPGRPAAGTPLRPEIQGLRALAVALVVVYHLWPDVLPGGYVGVDVFFTVSGFLIGGHLLRELAATGTLDLVTFWARRARRLLPASMTVLATCLLLTWAFVPVAEWGRFLRETGAATYYGLNWLLAGDAVTYSASDGTASPVQHFWSLSVEEQFYLGWPVLLLVAGRAAWLLARRAGRRPPSARWVAVATATLALAGSFWWSVRESGSTPAAYFVTTTRVWEFAAGALLAAVLPVVPAVRAVPGLRRLLSLAGAAVVVGTAFVIDGGTAFPGAVAAVPVVATLLVVAAGAPAAPRGRTRWLLPAWYRPTAVQRLGDWSYAVYLWHWPLLTLTPYVTNAVLTPVTRFAVLGATLVLAPLTTWLVENPVRRRPVRGPRDAWATFAAVAAAMALLLVLCHAGTTWAAGVVARQRVQAATVDLSGVSCLGAAAGVTGDCPDAAVAGRVVPRPQDAFGDSARYCLTGNVGSEPRICEFGVPLDEAQRVVALVGDSHGAQWQAAFEVVARHRGWHVYSFFKGSCQFADATRQTARRLQSDCATWNARVQAALRARPQISMLVTSAMAANEFVPDPGGTSYSAGVAGFRRTWAALPATVRDVWVIRDTPALARGGRQCLLLLPPADLLRPDRCGSPRSLALQPDPAIGAVLPLEASAGGGRSYHHIDLTDLLCSASYCPAVIGHVVVYRDTHHLTATFARTLVPYLEERLGPT